MVTFAEPSSAPLMLEAYHYVSNSDNNWTPITFRKDPTLSSSSLRIVTWNLNAGGPIPTKRFARILGHLRNTTFQNSAPTASLILFQEVHVETLQAILENHWIRKHFIITPNNGERWTTAYGVVSLISKDIPVSGAFYVELPLTRVGRHALFVDIHLSYFSSSSSEDSDSPTSTSPITPSSDASFLAQINRTLRIANTHLEPESSGGFRIRPKQLRTIAQMLNVANVHASICAGSMVSVQEADHKAPAQLGLADAYTTSSNRSSGAVAGNVGTGIMTVERGSETWGRLPHQFDLPPGRLDKVLYFPTEWVEVGCPKRIGDMLMALNEVFPSDHFGLLSVIRAKK